MWARVANVILGLWLVVSTLVFRDTKYQAINDMVSGILVIAFAMTSALSWKSARLFNMILGGWLMVNAIFVHHVSVAAAWNQGLVGYLVLAFAVVPRTRGLQPSPPVNW
jgi:hypothetical protein